MEQIRRMSAFNLLKTAIEHNALKLFGPAGGATPAEAAKRDAEYIKAFIAEFPQDPPTTVQRGI